MQCGVGRSRVCSTTIEKIDPGSNTTLTLTRGRGSSATSGAPSARRSAKRGLQFPDRPGNGDLPSAIGARHGTAAAAQDCPDPARMGRTALAAPDHLHTGAAGLADTIVMFSPLVRRELAGDPVVEDRHKMRTCAAVTEHRGSGRDLNCVTAAPPRHGRAEGW